MPKIGFRWIVVCLSLKLWSKMQQLSSCLHLWVSKSIRRLPAWLERSLGTCSSALVHTQVYNLMLSPPGQGLLSLGCSLMRWPSPRVPVLSKVPWSALPENGCRHILLEGFWAQEPLWTGRLPCLLPGFSLHRGTWRAGSASSWCTEERCGSSIDLPVLSLAVYRVSAWASTQWGTSEVKHCHI